MVAAGGTSGGVRGSLECPDKLCCDIAVNEDEWARDMASGIVGERGYRISMIAFGVDGSTRRISFNPTSR